MNGVTVTTANLLEPRDAAGIVWRLTKPESEWQLEVLAILQGKAISTTPVALWHADGCLRGWACSHVWREQQTLEMFVDERHRRSGIALALAACLVASGVIARSQPVAVFSPPTGLLCRRLGLSPVVYERSGDDWVRV